MGSEAQNVKVSKRKQCYYHYLLNVPKISIFFFMQHILFYICYTIIHRMEAPPVLFERACIVPSMELLESPGKRQMDGLG